MIITGKDIQESICSGMKDMGLSCSEVIEVLDRVVMAMKDIRMIMDLYDREINRESN